MVKPKLSLKMLDRQLQDLEVKKAALTRSVKHGAKTEIEKIRKASVEAMKILNKSINLIKRYCEICGYGSCHILSIDYYERNDKKLILGMAGGKFYLKGMDCERCHFTVNGNLEGTNKKYGSPCTYCDFIDEFYKVTLGKVVILNGGIKKFEQKFLTAFQEKIKKAPDDIKRRLKQNLEREMRM